MVQEKKFKTKKETATAIDTTYAYTFYTYPPCVVCVQFNI